MNKLLTIITVTFNAEQCIERTLRSVIGQSVFDDQIEYIIIDGSSKDKTLECISAHRRHIAHLVSEPDHGIYDAMNKGVMLSSSPWVMFMNAGDTFYDDNTVASLHLENRKADHIIYGDCVRVMPDGEEVFRKALPWWEQSGVPGIGICHQSIYMPAEWIKEHPFNWKEYPHCADFELVYLLRSQGKEMQYEARSLCRYQYGEGFSSCKANNKKVLNENARILGLNHSVVYYKLVVREWIHSLIKD